MNSIILYMLLKRNKRDDDTEIRVALRKQATRFLHSLIWNESIIQDAKKIILHNLIEYILTYGAEM